MKKKEKRKPFNLPPDQCERMVNSEMRAFRLLLTTLSVTASFAEDMGRQLAMIPYGRRRMNMALGQLRSLVADVTGTISLPQARSLMNTTRDCEIQLRVKQVGRSGENLVMTVDQGKILIEAAKRDMCMGCTTDGKKCRQCDLYKVLEATSPLDDYGGTELCPYNMLTFD